MLSATTGNGINYAIPGNFFFPLICCQALGFLPSLKKCFSGASAVCGRETSSKANSVHPSYVFSALWFVPRIFLGCYRLLWAWFCEPLLCVFCIFFCAEDCVGMLKVHGYSFTVFCWTSLLVSLLFFVKYNFTAFLLKCLNKSPWVSLHSFLFKRSMGILT